ncbi:MAG: dihydrolipoyl dehydrogenase family protein [Oscillospiraceae bacterium]|jgi:dihydrolipoamide dehydrogenase
MSDYQLAVIGGGPAGYTAALEAARLGLSTVLVEESLVGGTCLNRGCIPTKSILHSAEGGKDASEAKELSDGTSAQLRKGIEDLLRRGKVASVNSRASVPEPHKIKCADGTEFTADRILIATGSRPSVPPIKGLAGNPAVVDSDGFLAGFASLPEKIAIIGGGVIGVEFATACAGFGRQVTVLEALPRILSNLDRELSQSISMNLRKSGAAVHTGTMVKEVKSSGSSSQVIFEENGRESSCEADLILAAVGRKPVLPEFGFDIKTERGALVVSDSCETSVPGIYAAGDCTPGIQLAHRASSQAVNCVRMMCGLEPKYDLRFIPSCVYSAPEAASVGMDAESAKQAGIEAETSKCVLGGNARTLISGSGRGFIKVVTEKATGKIIGAQILCDRASDMIDEFTLAMTRGMTLKDMSAAVRPHPSYIEALNGLFSSI